MKLKTKSLHGALVELLGDVKVEKIRLFGENFLFIGAADHTDGAIATKEQYENFETNFAHLCSDGIIRSFGLSIGTAEDIEFLGKA